MAGMLFKGLTEQIATGTSIKTFLQITAPSNIRVRVLEWGVNQKGKNPIGEPNTWQLVRQTTAGTSTSLTLVKIEDSLSETIQSSAGANHTAEPTLGDTLDEVYAHPQASLRVPVPRDRNIFIGGGDRMGIRVVNADETVNAEVWILCEE